MFMYVYKVRFLDELDGIKYEAKESGLIAANSYTDATKQVITYYGDITEITLYECDNPLTEKDIMEVLQIGS